MKKIGMALAASVLICAAAAGGSLAAAPNGVVATSSGAVSGSTADGSGVYAFKGIAYAAPPVGPLRWRPPQPAPAHAGVREATQYGAACWGAAVPGLGPAAAGSEDCLSLNVWTPGVDKAVRRPVMVWIHGGGFVFGSSRQPGYDGARLAAHGVVVVTLNYRLGAFGFLAHPALDREAPASGDYGLQDQVAALKWVRDNIAAFGGDPSNVTLFGESAGAHAVGLLMASPLSKGLFHKAIIESGALWDSEHGSIASHAQALELGEALQAKLKAPDLAALRAVPAEEINQATPWNLGLDPGVTTFAPSLDGFVLPRPPGEVMQSGQGPSVPLLGGWNAQEQLLFLSRALPHATAAQFRASAQRQFGVASMAAFDRAYPSGTDAQAKASAEALVGDLVISEQTWETLGLQRRVKAAPVYVYQFGYTSPYSPAAAHVAEVKFVFGNLGPQPGPASSPPSEADRETAELMTSYWTNFAKRGDPNGPGLPTWPVYAGPGSQVMHIDAIAQAGPETGTERLGFIQSLRRGGRLPESWRTSAETSPPMQR